MKLVHPPPRAAVQDKFAAARGELGAALIEREEEIDLLLTALLAGEHALLVGPPGCGKSLLLDALLSWTGGRKFAMLFTKFSVPEECFGPVSLRALKEDKYVRVTTGKLPETEYAFLDELLKASSAILNTLLKLLNERTYDAGDGVVRPVPLKLCVAASNEWPSPGTGKELAALFDRFVLRKSVTPIRTQTGRQRLLWIRDHTPKLSTTVSPAEVDEARRAAAALPWSGAAKEALETILRELAREGIVPGDRRQFKTVGMVRAFAYLHGADEVRPEHLEVAQSCLWDDPHEQPQKVAQVIAKIANPTGMRVTQLLLEVESVLAATDVRNLADAAKAAAKLGEIDRQLSALSGNGRLEKARLPEGPAQEAQTRQHRGRLKPHVPPDRDRCGGQLFGRHAGFSFPHFTEEFIMDPPRPRPDCPLVVAYGIGVNSTAMLVEFAKRDIRPDMILFADTGGEKPETYRYMSVIRRYLKEVKFPPVVTVRYEPKTATYHTLEEQCLATGTLPSLAYGGKSCSLKHKRYGELDVMRSFRTFRVAGRSGVTVPST